MVHIPVLMDDGSTCTVATEAFYAPESPHKLLSESSLEKRKKVYIGPDKETGGRTILRYSDGLIVGRATCKTGLYVVHLATKPQYIAHASVQQFDINTLHRQFGHVGKDAPQKACYPATTKRQISRTTPTAKDTTKALRAFEKAAEQLTTNSLLAGRESTILMIVEGDKDYDDREDVDPDDNGVY
jgi:hypothetical protein